MWISSVSTCLLTLASLLTVQAGYIDRRGSKGASRIASDFTSKTTCANSYTKFGQSMGDWTLQSGSTSETCKQTPDGLLMRILPPHGYQRLQEEDGLAFNSQVGSGCTVNASTYMHYGSFSASIKASSEPGAVTAVILIADNGDEIDFELLAGPADQVTTNYFYGPKIVYGVNGQMTNPPSGNVYDHFINYKVEWSPSKITWYIDGQAVRTLYQQEEYPTHPSRVQIGLWDGSGAGGTASWARGPIDWKARGNKPVEAYIKDVKIQCDPYYNDII